MNKEKCLNFKDNKIENYYELEHLNIDIDFNQILDMSIDDFNIIYTKLVENAFQTENKNVCLYINIKNTKELNNNDIFFLIGNAVRLSITDKETGKNYMYTPLWFKDRVNCSALTQNKLGNFVNKFDRLQIVLSIYNEEIKQYEDVERLVN